MKPESNSRRPSLVYIIPIIGHCADALAPRHTLVAKTMTSKATLQFPSGRTAPSAACWLSMTGSFRVYLARHHKARKPSFQLIFFPSA